MKRLTHTLFIIIVAVMMVLSGCNDKKKVMKKPPHLINRITLVNILAESYLIESTLQMTVPDSLSKDELARRYYKDLFDRYHITSEQFESSVAYYVSEEKSAEKLLNDASALIVNKKNELMIDNPNPTAVPDTQAINQ
ncbi:MAG: DUF4296 domain-containing protein [Bacteroidales bacterium]|nr:DUF4296 domain-containing protein [Bacteroidales bacterium]